jgi:putative transposase
MPRRARSIIGGYAYHVLNRANGRLRLFRKEADYLAFEKVLAQACQRVPLRILGYTIMPNHWHFVVWPRRGHDDEVSEFFRWLTVTHSLRWHAHRNTTGMGHVYQGRFKSFPIEQDEHLSTVLRYVERNPLRARRSRAPIYGVGAASIFACMARPTSEPSWPTARFRWEPTG